jgi:ADP-ribosyl-[dinitrogen reductase] hydrolase
MAMPRARADSFIGCLLGMAVGDALGLPREGLSRGRGQRLFGVAPLRHEFSLGRGMISDDAEHACLVAQALLASSGDVDRFSRALAWGMRGWLLGLPAGIGRATLLSGAKLWLGWPPSRSGICSAGNGPAMRAPLLGVYAVDDPSRLAQLVCVSSRLTHTDPRAAEGALAIALAAAHAARGGSPCDGPALLASLLPHLRGDDLRASLDGAATHLARGAEAEEFAQSLGLEHGVGGFINHTVPVALFCWLRHPTDFRQAVESVILLGGDTDTTAAIVGGLAGAALGPEAIPPEWLAGVRDWPRSIDWMRRLAARLATAEPGLPSTPLPLFWPAIPLRNLAFTTLVLLHAARRLLPPY